MTGKMTHQERGARGGRILAERMSPEERRARAVRGAMVGAVGTIEKHWDSMTPELRARVLARVTQ